MKKNQLLISVLTFSSLHAGLAGCVSEQEGDIEESQEETYSLPGRSAGRYALARCENPSAELAGHLPIAMDILLAPNGKAGAIEQIGSDFRRGFTINVLKTKKNNDGSVTLDVQQTASDGLGGGVTRIHMNPSTKSIALRWLVEGGTHTTERVDSFANCKLSNLSLLTK
jgi:hypothetical protein